MGEVTLKTPRQSKIELAKKSSKITGIFIFYSFSVDYQIGCHIKIAMQNLFFSFIQMLVLKLPFFSAGLYEPAFSTFYFGKTVFRLSVLDMFSICSDF